mmetsp:Transcript_102/g.378  ORF Transcript_102/g.378 Transcript_102/m.378 type:complete len:440 (-) Transcript_102:88-1407(-)
MLSKTPTLEHQHHHWRMASEHSPTLVKDISTVKKNSSDLDLPSNAHANAGCIQGRAAQQTDASTSQHADTLQTASQCTNKMNPQHRGATLQHDSQLLPSVGSADPRVEHTPSTHMSESFSETTADGVNANHQYPDECANTPSIDEREPDNPRTNGTHSSQVISSPRGHLISFAFVFQPRNDSRSRSASIRIVLGEKVVHEFALTSPQKMCTITVLCTHNHANERITVKIRIHDDDHGSSYDSKHTFPSPALLWANEKAESNRLGTVRMSKTVMSVVIGRFIWSRITSPDTYLRGLFHYVESADEMLNHLVEILREKQLCEKSVSATQCFIFTTSEELEDTLRERGIQNLEKGLTVRVIGHNSTMEHLFGFQLEEYENTDARPVVIVLHDAIRVFLESSGTSLRDWIHNLRQHAVLCLLSTTPKSDIEYCLWSTFDMLRV